MKKILLGLLFALVTTQANAQSRVVTTCGTLPQAYATGSNQPPTIDVNGVVCSAPGAMAEAQRFFTATAPAAGAYVHSGANPGFMDTMGTGATSISVAVTAVGNAANRSIMECSNDSTFTGGGTAAGPLTVLGRFVGSVGTTADANTTAIALVVNRVYSFPVAARYCRFTQSSFTAGTDAVSMFLGSGVMGPINVQQSNGSAGGNTAWLVTATNSGGYPTTTGGTVSVAITAAGAGTTGAVTATLAGTAGKTTFVCGFDASAIGGTAAIGPITLTPLVGAVTFTYQASSSAAGFTLQKTFTPCIPASAAATGITMTTTADGTASAVNVNMWGYQL